MHSEDTYVKVLESFWPKNKAKGLLCQSVFIDNAKDKIFGPDAQEKIFPGCWLLSPKEQDFYKYRFCFFIHPHTTMNDEKDITPKKLLGNNFRPFFAIAEFLKNSGIGIVYCVPSTESGDIDIYHIINRLYKHIRWNCFLFHKDKFIPIDPYGFFERWSGNRGRQGRGTEWDPNVKTEFKKQNIETLKSHLLNELFFNGFLKGILKKPLGDPYDVDNFLISLSQKHIFPMEIKEKFPATARDGNYFGIDAGRILMLIRLCIPNDANAIYLIRELDEAGTFKSWKYMTLSDIIMTSSWNLQAGGRGMGGQATQTVRLPYDDFKIFNSDTISENNLQSLGSLPKDIKKMAMDVSKKLDGRFSPNQINTQEKISW